MNSQADNILQNQSGDLPVTPVDLLGFFDKIGVNYTVYKHEPVFSVAESTHLTETIPGVHCRNLFLRDKKKKMFLVVLANETAVDLKGLQAILNSDRLSFGSADRLWEYLGVRPGSVCPFAVMNDKDNVVTIILDAHMIGAELVCYHPMENHMSVTLTPSDLLKFLAAVNHVPVILDLAQAAQGDEV